jgi:hypothetical protein
MKKRLTSWSAHTAWMLALGGAFVVSAQAQETDRREDPARLEVAAVLLEHVETDSLSRIRLSANMVDAGSGTTTTVAAVEGDQERVYELLLRLAAELTEVDGAASGAAIEASTLYALGQMFETRGYKDLAADAYQAVMKNHPELEQAASDWRRLVGRWELNSYGGVLNDEPEFSPSAGDDQFRRDAIFGVRGAYHFGSDVFVQAEVANALATLATGGVRQNLNSFPVLGAVGYTFHVSHNFQLFPSLGAGAVFWRPDETPSGADLDLMAGVGGRLFLTRNHALRADMRVHHVPGALEATLRDLDVSTGQNLWALELSFGVSWFPAGG